MKTPTTCLRHLFHSAKHPKTVGCLPSAAVLLLLLEKTKQFFLTAFLIEVERLLRVVRETKQNGGQNKSLLKCINRNWLEYIWSYLMYIKYNSYLGWTNYYMYIDSWVSITLVNIITWRACTITQDVIYQNQKGFLKTN